MITSPVDTDSRGAFKAMSYDAQKQPQEVFCKKAILKNFSNFTRKHLRTTAPGSSSDSITSE